MWVSPTGTANVAALQDFQFLLLRWKLGGEEILIYLEMWKSFADFAANIAETTDCDEHEDK